LFLRPFRAATAIRSSCSERGVAEIVVIDALGHRGDGIVHTPEGPLYVPFALPGERVRIERQGERARLVEVLEPSPSRADPLCRHFGACGGCALQMMPLAESQTWKRELVTAALRREGLEAAVEDAIGVSFSSRRRTVLTATKLGERVLLGFNERLSNRIVDIEECPVLAGSLAEHLPAIRRLLAPMLGRKPARVTALLTSAGIDLDVSGIPAPDAAHLSALTPLAAAARIARLSVEREPLLTLEEPAILLSGISVTPPPGAFLQASAEAEALMAALVAGHLAGSRRVADLFSGLGTFALALALNSQVRAVESDKAALLALAAAARKASGLKPIETEQRDLFRHPLAPAELNALDGVVFDPPRAGAKAQAAALAASEVPRIAAVSCNPASFARDTRILADGGYCVERVVPVDQFVYSAETEVVGLFSRR
jgi:23S rRNA (uracil1939-C5)-methyltransferase